MKNPDRAFQTLTNFTPRPFQSQTIAHLLSQTNVILRAPTGSGKTETAIAPFLFAFESDVNFPKKLIYAVPLRTLANSLRDRTAQLVARFCSNAKRQPVVTLQTGENPEDPRFEGDIIFCTIDQLLSSYLNLPYSVGRGSSNLNAGAVLAAYLVFDEVHLLDPQRSLTTMLKLLQERGELAPFLVMTATLTQSDIATIRQEIQHRSSNTQIATVELNPAELATLEAGRNRQLVTQNSPLSASQIWDDLQQQQRRRVIVICNTILAAQQLYRNLNDLILQSQQTIRLSLIHSRFLARDRAQKEAQLQQEFGQKSSVDCPVILIATQVIEVGLNVSCDVLHTQVAPMNALVQRIGRCARFPHEVGQIFVYRQVEAACPNKEDDLENNLEIEKKASFAPYDAQLCESTWTVLVEHSRSRHREQSIGFNQEITWLEQVHTESDQLALQQRQENRDKFEQQFKAAIQQGDRSVIPDLIRHIESRRVYSIADTPLLLDGPETTATFDPNHYQFFVIPTRTLHGLFKQVRDSLTPIDWLFKHVQLTLDSETYITTSQLISIQSHQELNHSLNIVVNPRYVTYDAEIGLHISLEGGNGYTSPPQTSTTQKVSYRYAMDTYIAHIALLGRAWRDTFQEWNAVSATVKPIGASLLQRNWHLPEANAEIAFELLVYLAIWGHDLGKLQQSWQKAMRGWQAIAHQQFQGRSPGQHLLAHTDYDPSDADQKSALKAYEKQHRRPNHAIESACLFQPLFSQYFVPILMTEFGLPKNVLRDWYEVLQLAIGRHHSAWAKGWDGLSCQNKPPLALHPRASGAIARSWRALVTQSDLPTVLREINPQIQTPTVARKAVPLEKVPLKRLEIRLLYSLVVRALRLADIRAVQIANCSSQIRQSH